MGNSYARKEKKFNLILPEGDDKDSYTISDLATMLQVPTPSVQRYKMFLQNSGITTFPGSKGGRVAGGAGNALRYTTEQKNMFIDLVKNMEQGHTLKQAAEKVAEKVATAEKPAEPPAQPAKVDNLPNVIKEEDKQLLKVAAPKFKYGDIMEGVVTSIESYGVFINDGPHVRGLIHISNIKDGIVTDPNKYFTVGQRINAKVLNVKPDGKLSLSTKHLNKAELDNAKMTALTVEPNSNTIDIPISTAKNLTEMKLQLLQQPAQEETKQMATNQKIKAAPAPIMKDIQDVLKGKVGIISTPAEKRFTELFEKYGAVPFLMQLGVVSSNFEIDLGLLLAKELEQKLQCL